MMNINNIFEDVNAVNKEDNNMMNTGVQNVIFRKTVEDEHNIINNIKTKYGTLAENISRLNHHLEYEAIADRLYSLQRDYNHYKMNPDKKMDWSFYNVNENNIQELIEHSKKRIECLEEYGIETYLDEYEPLAFMYDIKRNIPKETLYNYIIITLGDYALIDMNNVDQYCEDCSQCLCYDEIEYDINLLQYVYESYHIDENDRYINCAKTLIISTSDEELQDIEKERQEYEDWLASKNNEVA